MYRRRGGFKGRGPIIRPPHYYDTNHLHVTPSPRHDESETPISQTHNGQSQEKGASNVEMPNSSIPEITGSHQVLDTSTTNLDNAAVNEETMISDETGNPEKADSVLDPNGLWFHHRDVVNVISETSYKSYFKGPYGNWYLTPFEAKQRWWNAFKHEFRWDPSNAKKVRKEWQSKCSRRLTDIVSKICTRPTYVAPWCAPSIREELIKIRKQEEFQLKSRQCSKNRMNNDSQKIHHRQGSISTEEVRCKLEKKLNRKPTAAELYFDGHVDNEGHFVNAKAEIVWKEFEKRKAENLECETENQKTEDQIFYDATGGWSDKGRIFGLGAAAHSYFERPGYNEKDKAKKSRRDYIVNLENKVADLIAENSQQKEELHVTKEGLIETQKNLAETTKSLKALEQQVQILMQANHGSLIPSSSSSSPRPHP